MRATLTAAPLLLSVALFGARALADEPTTPPTPPPTPAPTAPAEANPPGTSSIGVGIELGGDDDDALSVLSQLPPDVRGKLDGNQLEAIVRRAQENQTPGSAAAEVLAPMSFFLCIVLVVGAVVFARFRREKQLHETLRQMIERGVDIPPALLMPPQVKPNDRRRGVILISLGVGASAFLFLVTGNSGGAWGLGLVPAFLGVGYLLASFLEKRDSDAAQG